MKRKLIVACVMIFFLISSVGIYASANTTSFQSQGRIVFTNDTLETSDDVIFDSSDFTTLDNKLHTGLEGLQGELNSINAGLEDVSNNIDELVISSDKFEYVLDPNTGEIIGYKTDIGGDTVFSFNDGAYGSDTVVREDGYQESLTGTVGSGLVIVDSKILYISLSSHGSGSFSSSHYYEGNPIANTQTYTRVRHRDDGYKDSFTHEITPFDLGVLSEGGKAITFDSKYNGYAFKIYY